MTTNLLWLRRDLRRADHPALVAAGRGGAAVVPVFVLDQGELAVTGPARLGWLAATLRVTADSFEGRLCLRVGKPGDVLVDLARETGATAVHVTADPQPSARRADAEVEHLLWEQGIGWVPTDSPYAVAPGRVRTLAGNPYRVFTPFLRAWRSYGWPPPVSESARLRLVGAASAPEAESLLQRWLADCPVTLPAAGEKAAAEAWAVFCEQRLPGYAATRDRADLDSTSRLSAHLAVGAIHPRTLLADVAALPGEGPDKFVSELAWREFFADLLSHRPDSLANDLSPTLAAMAYDEPGERLTAWKQGRTGYPLVDAGMRQLLTEGWMHNRLRMVTASFLVKDLHIAWQHGAGHFQHLLIDFDPASNAHNWQWVAGTGADAMPYQRVFNPVSQADASDPVGSYVRRYVPELAHLPGAAALRPWDHPDGYTRGYPERIVDHAEERGEALTRHRLARSASS